MSQHLQAVLVPEGEFAGRVPSWATGIMTAVSVESPVTLPKGYWGPLGSTDDTLVIPLSVPKAYFKNTPEGFSQVVAESVLGMWASVLAGNRFDPEMGKKTDEDFAAMVDNPRFLTFLEEEVAQLTPLLDDVTYQVQQHFESLKDSV